MLIEPKLTAQEFSQLHNAKCALHGIAQSMEGVIHPDLHASLVTAIGDINKALKRSYDEEDKIFTARGDLFDRISKEQQFHSIWSIHEVDDFSKVPFPEARAVIYSNNWGQSASVTLPQNPTWLDLWKAADTLISLSGDTHHIFIEDFTPTKENSFILELSTGS